jgi:rhodanese-related sulfurtransferase
MDRLLEYTSHHPWLATATVVLIAFIIVYEMRLHAEGLRAISPQDLIRLMNQGALLLDLRPQEQYQAGHVAGARRMGSDEILKAGDTLKKHREKLVVVYDDRGALGAAAVRQLAAQGFTKAFALRGGFAAWRADNLPVARG